MLRRRAFGPTTYDTIDEQGLRMGLGRSLQISATGIDAQQSGIQVVGNNLANINSTSFKSSRTEFANLFYRTIAGRRRPMVHCLAETRCRRVKE